MTMFYIILLIVLGLLFLVAELVLLPGVSIGAILALVCYGSSIYLAFRDYGTVAGVVVILAILLLSGGRSRGLREFQRHRKDREGSARLAG